MALTLFEGEDLPLGQVTCAPGELPEGGVTLVLGTARAPVHQRPSTRVRSGELWLAADVWKRLAVPYNGMRLDLGQTGNGQIELGPAVAVLYPGRRISTREAEQRAEFYFGHLQGTPGLLALGFDRAIDWDRNTMDGFVVDNRPGREGEVHRATFPIPAAVRLTWAIDRDVIRELRARTGERTFNWVRNMDKGQFHTLLSAAPDLKKHLPETRPFRGSVDLSAMLARHPVVFVKDVYGIKGHRNVRVSAQTSGFAIRYMEDGRVRDETTEDLGALVTRLREVLGRGRALVQQGLAIVGRRGRSLHCRVITARRADGEWYVPVTTALVAPDERTIFTNMANGAREENAVASLREHLGMTEAEAGACLQEMSRLCLRAAGVLEGPFHPLGLLGFDVAVDAASRHLWLLEANTVPGWGYPTAIDRELARGQADYALRLTGFRK